MGLNCWFHGGFFGCYWARSVHFFFFRTVTLILCDVLEWFFAIFAIYFSTSKGYVLLLLSILLNYHKSEIPHLHRNDSLHYLYLHFIPHKATKLKRYPFFRYKCSILWGLTAVDSCNTVSNRRFINIVRWLRKNKIKL